MTHDPVESPEVFFLPLAIAEPARLREIGLEPGVLSRRIPDFLHQLLNQEQAGPTGMLEIQTPLEEGSGVAWVVPEMPADPEEAFSMLPSQQPTRALVIGSVSLSHESEQQLDLELNVYFRDDLTTGLSTTLQAKMGLKDPVRVLTRLAQRLAQVLGIPFRAAPAGLLTRSGQAFLKFLEGLDGSALLSGELEVTLRDDPEVLMEPYTQALALDPNFGLALRAAHFSLAAALDSSRIGEASCYRIIDRCLDALPVDGEGCVQMAEHLNLLGDQDRAKAWLVHATRLNPPPPRSLEHLGILLANEGRTVEARNLWLHGVELDGHPDFFAHLTRLAFTETDLDEAWDKSLRGLRRIFERTSRATEWEFEDRHLGLLMRYLLEHLSEVAAPAEVVEALLDLRGQLTEGEDRVDLGLCLLRVKANAEGREEVLAGLPQVEDMQTRDRAVRALLALEVPGFERRFSAAADQAATAKDPSRATLELHTFASRQPEFWPAHFFEAVGMRRLGRNDEALDLFAEVLGLRPGQPEALQEMAQLFAERGNPKRALECLEEALDSRPEDPRLHVSRAECLYSLHRLENARGAVEHALELDRHVAGARRLLMKIDRES